MKSILVTLSLLLMASTSALAQPAAFTYQGVLAEHGSPANGSYYFLFTLCDQATGGAFLGGSVELPGVVVSNGLFTAQLAFDASFFSGAPRWLEIAVKKNFTGDLPEVLNPRQPITPAPYAISAANLMSLANTPLDIKVAGERALRLEPTSTWVGSAISDAPNVIGGSSANFVSFEATGATIAGGGAGVVGDVYGANRNLIESSFAAIGGGMSNSISTQGEGAVIAGGTRNTIQSEGVHATIGGGFLNVIHEDAGNATIAGGRENTMTGDGGTISGGWGNTATAYAAVAGGQDNSSIGQFSAVSGGAGNINDREYASIGGGLSNMVRGLAANIGGGEGNRVFTSADHGTIGGGLNNILSSNVLFATIGGGDVNFIDSYSGAATISGGGGNAIGYAAGGSTISGGGQNYIRSSSSMSTVSGGFDNGIETNCYASVIAGGLQNFIQPGAWQSVISGGVFNYIRTNSAHGTISGGYANQIEMDTRSCSISGGEGNRIRAGAIHAAVPGGRNNVAAGLYSLAAGHAAQALHAGVFIWADSAHSNHLSLPFPSTATNEFAVRATGGTRFVSAVSATGVPTAGVELAPGSGAWSMLSDRNAKENFSAVNPRSILEKVASLSLATWNYKSQDKAIRHIGPTAQDFHAAFGVGENERTIATVDTDGVALAAIQGLNQKFDEQLKAKDAHIETLEQRIVRLEKLISGLTPAK